jgi:hypothetical protein
MWYLLDPLDLLEYEYLKFYLVTNFPRSNTIHGFEMLYDSFESLCISVDYYHALLSSMGCLDSELT